MTVEMPYHPLRLNPGEDLRGALEALVAPGVQQGYFVLSGIGSLSNPRLRFAGADDATLLVGDHELLSLSGTVTAQGAHLHAVVSGPDGAVTGGHVVAGNAVRTTAEILLLAVPGWQMQRQWDAATGYPELVVRRGLGAQGEEDGT